MNGLILSRLPNATLEVSARATCRVCDARQTRQMDCRKRLSTTRSARQHWLSAARVVVASVAFGWRDKRDKPTSFLSRRVSSFFRRRDSATRRSASAFLEYSNGGEQ